MKDKQQNHYLYASYLKLLDDYCIARKLSVTVIASNLVITIYVSNEISGNMLRKRIVFDNF